MTATTNVGRLPLAHPDLGEPGGVDLHAAVRSAWTKLADMMGGRYFEEEDLDNAASVDFVHNYNVALSDIRIKLYSLNTGTGELTRLTAQTTPSLDDFTIAATPGSTLTSLRVTNNTGGQEDIACVLEQGDERDVKTFNATTDWGSAAGGYYTITRPDSDHHKGVSPIVQVYEKVSTDYIKVEPDRVLVNSSGDVSIRVTESPDLRFEGKLVLM